MTFSQKEIRKNKNRMIFGGIEMNSILKVLNYHIYRDSEYLSERHRFMNKMPSSYSLKFTGIIITKISRSIKLITSIFNGLFWIFVQKLLIIFTTYFKIIDLNESSDRPSLYLNEVTFEKIVFVFNKLHDVNQLLNIFIITFG